MLEGVANVSGSNAQILLCVSFELCKSTLHMQEEVGNLN